MPEAATLPSPSPISEQAAHWPAATLQGSLQTDFNAQANGRRYRVRIALPHVPAIAKEYPVLLVLDGDPFFGCFAEAVRLRSLAREIAPAVVVGVSYADADIWTSLDLRNRDFIPTQTSPRGLEIAREHLSRTKEFAGSDDFRRVLHDEVLPKVRQAVPSASGPALLWGHSLGGLFVLETLFRCPSLYAAAVASDPSLFWDDGVVLNDLPMFEKEVVSGRANPRLLITVSEKTQLPYNEHFPGSAEDRDKMSRRWVEARNLDRCSALGQQLASLPGRPGYEARTMVVPRDHNGMVFECLNDVLDFLLPAPWPQPR